MKQFSTCLLVVLLLAGAVGQSPSGTAKPASRAVIEGLVTKDPDGEPVKKALIELIADNQAEGGDYTAVTGPDGVFRIENILPGRYHLFAERPGFLDVDKHRGHSDGRVLTIAAGQEVKDLRIRVQAAAVVRGRVTDEDGDPLAGAEVTVLRQTFFSGHHHWEQVGTERTNDLGEYRVAALPAGNVYVSVTPPPDFKALIQAGGVSGAEPRANVADKPATAYQTTYYPGTTDRGQAAPVQLHAGDDFPVNFSLIPEPSLSIRGSVLNLPPRTSATIMLQSRDFNLVMTGGEMHKDGSFVIRDVSPGSYTILATVDGSPVPMMARQSLQVGTSNVEGVRLTPQAGASVRGRMQLVSKGSAGRFDPSQIFVALQPVEGAEEQNNFVAMDRFSNLAHIANDGSFEWKDVPPGNYYVQIVGDMSANEGWFLKSVSVNGREVTDSGFSINGGAVALELVASAAGASLDGVVVDHKGEAVANAVVVAIPEARMRGRVDRYSKTVSDQSGHFVLRGIRPGDYTMLAWESVDGEAYYSPEFVKGLEAQGSAIRVEEGDRKRLQLEAIPDSEKEP